MGRRMLSIPLVLFLCALLWGTAPVWAPLALVSDLLRGGPLRTFRFLAHLTWVLSCESCGIFACSAFWLARLVLRTPGARYRAWHLQLQLRWGTAHFLGIRWIYGTRVQLEQPEILGSSPMLLFIRHASLLDTILPSAVIQAPHGIGLRHIMKKELLWEPCVDMVGHRLPNCFVDRYSADSSRQIDTVRRMMADLGPHEGVLIYPEGTRPTPAKRERAMVRLRERDPEFARRVEGFRHVLPPRPGGPLALLEDNPGLDVVFCAHTGFEEAATIADLASGGLIDRTIRVRFWKVPFREIPAESDARVDWLIAHWRKVDAWIDAQQPAGVDASSGLKSEDALR